MSSLQFRGVTYPNAKVACDQLNISYADFNRLVDETDQSDLGCIEILYKDKYEQPESRKKLLDKPVSIKNFKYRSVWEACKMLNLCPEYVLLTGHVNKQDLDESIKMLQRLHIRGFIDSTPSLKKLLEKYSTAKDPVVAKAVNDAKPEKIKPKDNVVTKTKEAVAKLSKWIQDGRPEAPMLDDIIKEPEQNDVNAETPTKRAGRHCKPFEFEGDTYSSIKEFCDIWNITPKSIYAYSKRHPEKSTEDCCRHLLERKELRIPRGKSRGHAFVHRGVTYANASAFCMQHGRSPSSLSALKLKHPEWSQEQLCDALLDSVRHDTIVITHNGVIYNGSSFSEALGYTSNRFSNLKHAHPDWSIDQIVNYMLLGQKRTLAATKPEVKEEPKVAEAITPKQAEPVINAIPSNPVAEIIVPKNVDPAVEKLRVWRLAGQRTKMELVGVSDMAAFKAWKDDAVASVLKSGPIYPDKVNAPWLKIDDVESVIDQACADFVEIAYLVNVHKVDLMKAINLCRADTELDNPTQEELNRLQAEVKSLRDSVDSLYCKDCGDLIAPQFSKAHPGTCYCQNCYDKHND